jgi:predicted Rossmann fold nucleotide-binding protein DprA/Smf involved in DNA uptake
MSGDKTSCLARASEELEARGQQLLRLAELLRQVDVAWMEPTGQAEATQAAESKKPRLRQFDAPRRPHVQQADVLASLGAEGSSLDEICRAVGLCQDSVRPHLYRLRLAGLVTKDDAKRYRRADPPLAKVG